MTALDLVILALATWRLSFMVAREKGPFSAFERLRVVLPLGGLTACLYCVSVWVSVGLYLLWGVGILWPAQLCAISGLAIMLYRYTGGDHV